MALFFIIIRRTGAVSLFPVFSAEAQCVQPTGDNDGDGIADAVDLDDDNDGIPDLVEDGYGSVNWTAAQLNSLPTTPFTTTIPGGAALGFQSTAGTSQYVLNSATPTSYNTVLSTDMGGTLTVPRVLGISSW